MVEVYLREIQPYLNAKLFQGKDEVSVGSAAVEDLALEVLEEEGAKNIYTKKLKNVSSV